MNFDKFSSITTDGTHEMLCFIDIVKNNLPHNHIIFQKTYCDLHKINWVVQHTLNTLQIIQTISNWLTSKSITRLLYMYKLKISIHHLLFTSRMSYNYLILKYFVKNDDIIRIFIIKHCDFD